MKAGRTSMDNIYYLAFIVIEKQARMLHIFVFVTVVTFIAVLRWIFPRFFCLIDTRLKDNQIVFFRERKTFCNGYSIATEPLLHE